MTNQLTYHLGKECPVKKSQSRSMVDLSVETALAFTLDERCPDQCPGAIREPLEILGHRVPVIGDALGSWVCQEAQVQITSHNPLQTS